MNSTTLRRLASDHASLHRKALPPYYLFPAANAGMPDDLTQLTILLTGPQGTPYADGVWKLSLRIPSDYPKSPPKAFFKTKIWHPNVEESSGSVCLDTLKRDWQPKLTLRDILITISCLLINPNPDSALNSAAGKLVQEDWDKFVRHAKLMTSIHAKAPPNLKDAILEARSRGEDAPQKVEEHEQAQAAEPVCQPIAEDAQANAESDEEEENSKENEPSTCPSPDHQQHPDIIRRPTILGKRPLSDLPTPVEPASDDEDGDPNLSRSERNIVANTPNLSNHIACLSFSTAPTSFTSNASLSDSSSNAAKSVSLSARRPSKLVERTRGPNFTPAPHTTISNSYSGSSFPPSSSESSSIFCDETASQPTAKRVCSPEGKENSAEEEIQALSAQPKPAPLVGLGVKMLTSTQSTSAAASRKGSATSVGNMKAKAKARVGMRRL